MSRLFLLSIVLLMAMGVSAFLACGADDMGYEDEAAMPAATAAPATLAPTMAPAAAPTMAPTAAPTAAPAPAADESSEALKVQASPQVQTRVIIHTANVSLVVGDVAQSVDWIAGLAHALGGWVVSSDRTSMHNGAISIRIPAASLEDALSQLEGIAVEVESRTVTSQDVTDQYVDYQSRLVSMKATEQRLLSFLERAGDIEDALGVHKELADLQVQIEEIQGRINFLEQTSAFSLIDVSLKLTPQTLQVDAGADFGVEIGKTARFRASFFPPEGIDEYQFTWDFGDGNSTGGNGTILRPDGRRVTATVNHMYRDDTDSPYIARIDLRGFGESGVAEGSDALEVTVSEVPAIEVFAGEGRTVKEGEEVEYTASFLRPAELWDYKYRWNFGDGSPTVTGTPEEGGTRLSVLHTYTDYRPQGYEVQVSVNAMSEGGEVTGSGSFWVEVTESKGLIVGGWEIGETTKDAVRALSAVVRVVVMILIWLAIFSPVIAIVAGVVYLIKRIDRRNLLKRKAQTAAKPESPETVDLDEPKR